MLEKLGFQGYGSHNINMKGCTSDVKSLIPQLRQGSIHPNQTVGSFSIRVPFVGLTKSKCLKNKVFRVIVCTIKKGKAVLLVL